MLYSGTKVKRMLSNQLQRSAIEIIFDSSILIEIQGVDVEASYWMPFGEQRTLWDRQGDYLKDMQSKETQPDED